MRNTIIALTWVILFILFGVYIDSKVETFCIDYTKDVQATYEVIHDENWDEADKKLDDLVKKLDRQKDFWLKVLDHQYYDDLNLELGLAKNKKKKKNKIRGLESLEKVESILQNLMADEKCNWNYIF